MADKKKILIVDDNADLQMLLALRLNAANGFEVLSAPEEDAMRQAEKSPDAIILDVMLPEKEEGYAVFSRLKMNEITKDIPIIFLTRKTEDRKRSLEMGGSYFVTKPFESKDLPEKIQAAIEGKKEGK